MRLRILSIVPLLALTLAACGGGGSKSSTTTSAPTTATSAPSSTPAGSDPAATARAQKLVLVQADFP
ncbi:MAG: TlpA family protein disulfide reductase, partial [Acidimicrobiia bacterium]|nr:TlpA family protein disulfide reductase [Acidimicrobiia bacterium]